MIPMPNPRKRGTSGIDRVIEAYLKTLPQFGIDFVDHESDDFDLLSAHAGSSAAPPDVCHCHGLYFTGDYDHDAWQLHMNANVISSIRHAKEVTVPSKWVAEVFQRDMRFTPHVVPHGIDWQEWQHNEPRGNYVLYNKNREGDVCSSLPVVELARRFTNGEFITTFLPRNSARYNNVDVVGIVPHDQMKKLVQSAAVYLSPTKETFGIGVLEAMAAGVPVLGFAHGGNVDLVEQGVNGYLAQPGNYDDLAEGLDYCIRYRDTLGDNGREMAKAWTWERACEQGAKVYEKALIDEPPTDVAIVIPVFNKTDEQLGRAIESAVKQTYKRLYAVIVVDDGSEDKEAVEAVVRSYQSLDVRVGFFRQDNSGVSAARNKGIEIAGGAKYVCCLDADDAIAPEFISECVRELESDRSLGIAYTKIRAVAPDGSTSISAWPDEFDYDRQLKKQNQIPTCNVFRREMWERLGGYNSKWEGAGGAGAEDADLWLRAGAFGWGAKMASRQPLFIYSLGGTVSANPNYVEPDWTELYPWAGVNSDGMHPFASVATPKRFSHLVRQYDEPVVSVIIPVGPGHEEKVRDALNSLEYQSMRKWEAIVVLDGVGFAENDAVGKLQTAYPYAKIKIRTMDPYNPGPMGAGWARNFGVTFARAPFLVFLDADDWLYPKCLERMLEEWNEHQSIIYTDYVGKTFIENPADLDPTLQERMYYYDEKNKEAVIGYRAAEYKCEVAQEQPRVDSRGNIYVWTNVTALIPKAWHNEIGGFDEKMPSWEDIDYHWRFARAGKCYHRIPEELMVYQFHTGNRRERGRQEYPNLLQYLEDKYKEVETMACSGCGGRRSPNPAPQTAAARSAAASRLDSEMILCSYMHLNRGSHSVVGAAQFNQPPPDLPTRRIGGSYRIDYGYRAGAGQEQFYVHREDIKLAPHLFLPVQEKVAVAVPVEEKQVQAPPERIVLPEPERQAVDVRMPMGDVVIERADGIQPEEEAIARNILRQAQRERDFDLQTLPGIGSATAELLKADGIRTKEDVLGIGIEGLAAYKGIGGIKAEMIIEAIQELPE